MLQLEGYVEIQVLRRQGKSIRAISAELGVARNTVRKYLRAERAPRSKPRPARASKLDAFRQGLEPLSAFVATLGYSRYAYVEFVTDQSIQTLLRCHTHAFEWFEGVPQRVLYDNMKTVILSRHTYGPGLHRFQPAFLDFAHHYGFLPQVCRPYRAKTKGKVERFIRYLRYSFYVPLLSRLRAMGLALDAQTANTEVRSWLHQVANARVHATTQAVPQIRCRAEREELLPVPEP